jgi:hypothetical protein
MRAKSVRHAADTLPRAASTDKRPQKRKAQAVSIFQGSTFNVVTLGIALLGLLVATAGVLYQRRGLFPPKRRLTLSELPPAPLLADESASAAGVKVTYQGRELTDAYVTTLSVENTGKHAIDEDQFSKDRAITVDLGAPIRAILKTSVVPGSNAEYFHKTDGTSLLLGPDLLNPGQSVIIQALTEGHPKTDDLDTRTRRYLADTVLEFRDRQVRPRLSKFSVLVGVATIVGAVIGVIALLASLLSAQGMSVSVSPDNGPTGTAVTVAGKGVERFAVIEMEMPKPHTPPTDYQWVEVANTQADGDGKFRVTFNVPSGYEKGAVDIDVTARENYGSTSDQVTFYVR